MIRIFGQNVSKPLIKENFIGIKNQLFFLKVKTKTLLTKCRIINKSQTGKKIIEIHNRPYLVNTILKNTKQSDNIIFSQ